MPEYQIVTDARGQAGLSLGLAGRSVVVTGGAGGIGLAISKLMLDLGANVALSDITAEVEERARELNADKSTIPGNGAARGRAIGVRTDVTDSQAVKAGLAEIVSRFGTVDVVVHSAGVAFLEKAEKLQREGWDKTLTINLTAAFVVAQAAFPYLKEHGGVIINIASQAAEVAIDQHVAYCASKAGLVGMTKVLALEWGPYGIRANCVSPTIVMTPMARAAWTGERAEKALANIPMGRFVEPHEVASTVAYLASDSAKMITGANILIDGGWTAS